MDSPNRCGVFWLTHPVVSLTSVAGTYGSTVTYDVAHLTTEATSSVVR